LLEQLVMASPEPIAIVSNIARSARERPPTRRTSRAGLLPVGACEEWGTTRQ